MENTRCIRRIKPQEIFTLESDGKKEFYYYKHLTRNRIYTYRVTYIYEVWKDALDEIGCSWEDIKNKKLMIELYRFGGIKFIKIND